VPPTQRTSLAYKMLKHQQVTQPFRASASEVTHYVMSANGWKNCHQLMT